MVGSTFLESLNKNLKDFKFFVTPIEGLVVLGKISLTINSISIMKKSVSILIFIMIALFSGCSNSDDGPQQEEVKVLLSANKSVVLADGKEMTSNIFKTERAGTYKITAVYQRKISATTYVE